MVVRNEYEYKYLELIPKLTESGQAESRHLSTLRSPFIISQACFQELCPFSISRLVITLCVVTAPLIT
jgi:hypothetical protein